MKTLMLHIPGRPPLPLEGEDRVWTLGRSSQNDITISDASLSRFHARISRKDGTLTLEDLGSLNGTTLNGLRIAVPHPLQEDDELQLGQVSLRLEPLGHGPRVRISADLGDSSSAGSLVLPLEALRAAPERRRETPETLRLREVIRDGVPFPIVGREPPQRLNADTLWEARIPVEQLEAQAFEFMHINLAASLVQAQTGQAEIAAGLIAAVCRRLSLLTNLRDRLGYGDGLLNSTAGVVHRKTAIELYMKEVAPGALRFVPADMEALHFRKDTS